MSKEQLLSSRESLVEDDNIRWVYDSMVKGIESNKLAIERIERGIQETDYELKIMIAARRELESAIFFARSSQMVVIATEFKKIKQELAGLFREEGRKKSAIKNLQKMLETTQLQLDKQYIDIEAYILKNKEGKVIAYENARRKKRDT